MEIHAVSSPPLHILRLAGRWDTFSSAPFKERCSEMIQNENMRYVIIDLSEVDYISSFGLRALLNLGKELEAHAGKVCVSALRPHVRKVFQGSGFGTLFDEYSSAEAAIQALRTELA